MRMVQDITGAVEVDGRRIATRSTPAPTPDASGLLWLPGYNSDMASTKASALADLARGRYAMTRFDYSGHGESGGRFEDGTVGRWLDETAAVFTQVTTGPQLVIGSSMGGYLALLLLRRLLAEAAGEAARIRALVLIAPAWDMTERLMWDAFGPDERQAILEHGFWLRPSAYGAPYRITRRLIEDGQTHLIGGSPFNPGRPVHILQGLADVDVPAAHTRGLMDLLPCGHVTLEEIPDGDHRLSRPEDIARLWAVVQALA